MDKDRKVEGNDDQLVRSREREVTDICTKRNGRNEEGTGG